MLFFRTGAKKVWNMLQPFREEHLKVTTSVSMKTGRTTSISMKMISHRTHLILTSILAMS